MSEKPILFSGSMVRAILAGQKTQTRRILKDQETWNKVGEGLLRNHPQQRAGVPVFPGDRLWVRESFRARAKYDRAKPSDLSPTSTVIYEADEKVEGLDVGKLRPGIFMPRWASRITLVITDVRVQRLVDLSEEDAKAEGIEATGFYREDHPASICFSLLWDSINGSGSWNTNPWVYAVSFERAESIDDRTVITRVV